MNPAGMIWQLMRRDPAWRMMPSVTLMVAAFCTLWHFFAPVDKDGIPSIFLFAVSFGVLILGLMAVLLESADTAFEAIMPITVRQIFLSRMLSMAVMMLLPVIAGLAVLAALKDPLTSDLPLEIWTPFVCTLLGIQCFAIRRNIRPWLIVILLPAWAFVCAVAGIGDLLDGGFGASLGARAACWLIIVAVVLRTWQVLPPSFQDAPMRMSPALPLRRATAHRKSGAPSWKTWLHIALLTSGWVFIQAIAVVLLGPSNPFMLFLLGFQWPAIGRRLRWLFSLPVSPRILICAATLPTLLALCGGYAVSIRQPWIPVQNVREVSVRHLQEPGCKTLNAVPSLQYWIPVRTGKAPPIEAPWGETFQPPVNRVTGLDIYDPYAVGCDNSQRFLAWQSNRATVAIHELPGLRTQVVTIGSLMAFSLLSLLIAMTFDWHRMRRLPAAVRLGAKWLVGAAAFGLLLWIGLGDIDLIQWISWSLPASATAATAIECAVIAVLFLAIDRLFRHLEFTDKPPDQRSGKFGP